MRYTFVNEDGKSETFDLNTAELDLDNVLQVPDYNNKVEGTIANTGIFNEDGSINPSYAPLDENGQPELETVTEIVDGKKITTTNQIVDTEGIIQQYTDAGMNAMGDMTHAQKVSIWKNTIAPALKDYEPEDLAYDSETGEFTKEQAAIFNAGVGSYLGDMALMKVEAATKDNYNRTMVEAPKASTTSKTEKVVTAGIEGIVSGDRNTFTKGTTRVKVVDTAGMKDEDIAKLIPLDNGKYARVENKTTLGWAADTNTTTLEGLYDTFGLIEPELRVNK